MLYIRHDLMKSVEAKPVKAKKDGSPESKTGEQRGGQYAARVQTGYEKDGSPRYKYFKTLDARDKYLQSRGNTKEDSPKKTLKTKLKTEQKDSKEKQKASHGKVESGKLFVSKDKDKDKKKKDEETSKSLSVFIWRLE